MRVIYQRCAGIDVAKDEIAVCVRTPGEAVGERRSQVRKYKTFYGVLEQMCAWLRECQVSTVAMESTGVYSHPVFHALMEFGGFEVVKCNAAHVKNVPGRKTDAADCAWLAELLECGLLKGSFIPAPQVAAARDYTRYRAKLVAERGSEAQRLQNTLEDAGIKLGSVAADVLGVSGRAMIEALIDGERRGSVLADLAKGRMRSKIANLTMALTGRFSDHHAGLCAMHLKHIDALSDLIADVDAHIEELMVPFARERALLATIPGIAERTAAIIIAEIGVDMSYFPDAGHLASWAGLAPANNQSGGRQHPAGARHGNRHLGVALTQSAWVCSHTKTRPGAQFHRLVHRFGGYRSQQAKAKAAVAIAHTLILIIYHVLASGQPYQDLGEDFYTKRENPQRRKDKLINQLTELGYTVTVKPTTAA